MTKDKPLFPVLYEFRKKMREKKLREKAVDGAVDTTIMGLGSAGAKRIEENVLRRFSRRP